MEVRNDSLEISCNGMSMVEAREIAYRDCEGGLGDGLPICNEDTQTWCMDSLQVTEDGSHPVCVINTVTKEAEINWRCIETT